MTPYYQTEKGALFHADCLDFMRTLPENHIDLTITSPPYDNLREYKGCEWNFEVFKPIARELFRITKKGGVVVWVVGDATINGGETGTSFRQALYFKEVGFNLETMIWEKTGSGCLGSQYFYSQNFEFMFILTKGFPVTKNLIKDRINIKNGKITTTNSGINKKGKAANKRIVKVKKYGKRNNIWKFDTQKNSLHPAPFPEKLAADHMISWSNEGDLVFDPFGGSGTVAKQAELLKRRWLSCEIAEEYCEIFKQRVEPIASQMSF